MKNFWITFTIIILIIIGGIAALEWGRGGPAGSAVPPAAADDWTRGSGSVSLIEYSDFQCPACAAHEPLLSQLLTEFDGRLSLTYRHFPLSSIHPNADASARASEAAGLQGKFWEIHDALFDNQLEWSEAADPTELFIKYASNLGGLDTTRFQTDLNGDAASARVSNDAAEAVSLNLNSTPTFFLNGRRLVPRNYDDFVSAVNAELSKN